MDCSFTVKINTFNRLKTSKDSKAFCGEGVTGKKVEERTGSGIIWMEPQGAVGGLWAGGWAGGALIILPGVLGDSGLT